ncbi:MAG: VOC family protein [Candidatus Eisenbacteria bacterium]
MTEKTTYAPGTFCWPELSTSAQGAAETFYTKLFDWTLKLTPMGEDSHYTIFLKGDRDVAAGAQMQPETAKAGVPTHWLSYISVANVDETVKRAEALGGKLIAGPFDVMEHGRMAVLSDPSGAAFALWQAKQHPGAALLDAPGSLVWTELATDDVPKACAFYTKLIGWTTQIMPMGALEYTLLKRGDVPAGGVMPLTKEMSGVPPHWGVYFGVTDCDATVAKAKGLGAAVIQPGVDVPGVGRLAVLRDPQGGTFSILQAAS